ncbi:hypothetical protein BV22DRAFT_202330 [Leucogyrophana mollusca]|uniref:Uncharacterized protein n=1 Tax=Leucogyrophana mollusca TaxID=85980 RepID=A0ACB8BSV3_9AGAM|nr:hypothetical protein BV22DRAFT_202330 [Leucogyrophana mollusca]
MRMALSSLFFHWSVPLDLPQRPSLIKSILREAHIQVYMSTFGRTPLAACTELARTTLAKDILLVIGKLKGSKHSAH